MTVSRARGAKAKADKYFSLIVRARGKCENCGSTANLQTMHVISRRYSRTRCDLRNAFCGCARCHRWFTDNPLAFAAFVTDRLPSDDYDDLCQNARTMVKVDWDYEANRLQTIWKTIEATA